MALPAEAGNILTKWRNYEAADPTTTEGLNLGSLHQIDLDNLDKHDFMELRAASNTLFAIARTKSMIFDLTREEVVQTEMLANHLQQSSLTASIAFLREVASVIFPKILFRVALSVAYTIGCHIFWPGWDLRDQTVKMGLKSFVYWYPISTYKIIQGCVELARGRFDLITTESGFAVFGVLIHLATELGLRFFLRCVTSFVRVLSHNDTMRFTSFVIVSGFCLIFRSALGQLLNTIWKALCFALDSLGDILTLLFKLGSMFGFKEAGISVLMITTFPLDAIFKIRYGSDIIWKALKVGRFFAWTLLTTWNFVTITRRITMPLVAAQVRSSCMMITSVQMLKRVIRAWAREAPIESLPDFSYHTEGAFNSRKDIRLLHLVNNSFASTLQLKMRPWPLDQAPPYEAISYVWNRNGSTETETILVNNHRLRIPANVYNVLSRRSKASNGRPIWIDTLCINQADTMEKTYQVRMMAAIYQKAAEVVVYLGESPRAWLANSFLEDIMKSKAMGPGRFHIFAASLVFRSLFDQYLCARIDAFSGLLLNEWFERVWIVQEVSFAKSIKVIYGGQHISWSSLIDVLPALSDTMLKLSLRFIQLYSQQIHSMKRPSLINPLFLAGINLQRKNLVKYGSTPLLETMVSLNRRRATKPIDRIFALLGMTDQAEELQDMIDYSRQDSEILIDLALHFLRSGHLLPTLYYAGVGWINRNGVPSWVADWTMGDLPRSLTNQPLKSPYHASADEEFVVEEGSNSKEIILSGHLICRIKVLGMAPPDASTVANLPIPDCWPATHDMFRRWIEDICSVAQQHAGPSSEICDEQFVPIVESEARYHYQPTQSLREATIRTLLADRAGTIRPAPFEIISAFERELSKDQETDILYEFVRLVNAKDGRREEAWRNVQRFIQEYVEKSGEENNLFTSDWNETEGAHNDLAMLVENQVMENPWMANMIFCVFDDGRLGLVPPRTREGDWVAIISGAEIPFILREASDGTGKYQIVGQAYVHGMMDGEGLALGKENAKFVII